MYNNVNNKRYFNYSDKNGTLFKDNIKTTFKYIKENLFNELLKERAIKKLKFLKEFIQSVDGTFGLEEILIDLHIKIEKKHNNLKRIVSKKSLNTLLKTPNSVFYTLLSKIKKEKELDFQSIPFGKTTLKKKDKKEIEKIIKNS